MSLILGIKCPMCKKYFEIESETYGNTINMQEFYNNGFIINTPDIEIDTDVEDIDDVEGELRSISIHCKECGEYVSLENWR